MPLLSELAEVLRRRPVVPCVVQSLNDRVFLTLSSGWNRGLLGERGHRM